MTIPTDEKFDFIDFIPKEWKNLSGENSVIISGYRIAMGDPKQLTKNPIMIELNGACAIILDGSFPYWQFTEYRSDFISDKGLVITAKPEERKTEPGLILLLVSPTCLGGQQISEGLVLDKLSSVKGILSATLGQNIAAIHLFTNVFKIDTKQFQIFGEALVNPLSMPKPQISESALNALNEFLEILLILPEEKRNRVWLALHWYDLAWSGRREDGFLKMWIALEVLAMPSSTNIYPIKVELAKLYSKDAGQDDFKVGLLFGLRSEIVHNGFKATIHSELFNYIDSMFIDTLFSICGVKSDRKIQSFLDRTQANLEKLIKSALPTQ